MHSRGNLVAGGLLALGLSLSASLFAHDLRLETLPSGAYRFVCDGAPFELKGAGGTTHLAELRSAGANAVRTWDSEQTDRILDEAERLGLGVCAGLWIEHERHGADYRDPRRFQEEVEKHCRTVDRLKDRPGLLLWGIGNEVETLSTNERVWEVIEAVAAYIRRVDTKHPTMVVIAHPNPEVIAAIRRHCPSIQLLGSNTYGALHLLPADVRRFGWSGPYLVTEWGCDGNWESPKTPWGAEVEPTSSQKAEQFRSRYAIIRGDAGVCLGSFAFLWGHKQEVTPTWFGLYTKEGLATPAVEVLAALWGGKQATLQAPALLPPTLNGQSAGADLRVAPGAALVCRCKVDGGKTVSLRWEVRSDAREQVLGGDPEREPPALKLSVEASEDGDLREARVQAPAHKGRYRVYVYAQRGDRVATANIPFLVE